MKHLKLFEAFNMDDPLLDIANEIITAITGPMKGTYLPNSFRKSNYRFMDGTVADCSVSQIDLCKKGDMIAVKYAPKEALDELYTLTGKKADFSKMYSLGSMCISVNMYEDRSTVTKRSERGKNEISAQVWLGPQSGGNFKMYSPAVTFDKKTYKQATKQILENVKETSSKITGKMLLKVMFDDLAWSKLLPVKKQDKKSASSHIGIGSAASINVRHDIKMEYDVKKYVDKYGEKSLLEAMEGTYFKKRFFIKLEDGVLYTDESWTDVYD